MREDTIIEWSEEKNEILRNSRGISFQDIATCVERDEILDIIPHFNKQKYPNQEIYIIEIDNYIYAVPFVRSKQKIFLKTVIPSRKYTKLYLK